MSNKPTYEELEKRIRDLEQIGNEREKSNKALREIEQKFRFFYQNAPIAYQSLDENGHLIEVNNAWLETLGYDRKEVIGKSFGDFLHPDWKDHFNENFPRFKAVGEILDVEFEMVKKDGALIAVSFNGKIDTDSEGYFHQTHCIFEDITEMKRTEGAFQESEERYRSFVQHFRGIAYRSRMDFIPIFFHGAVEEITGYTEGEFVDGNPRWDQVIHPEDLPGLFTADEEKLHSIPRYSYEREYRIVRKDGSVRWVHDVIQNVCDASGKPAILQGAIYDITDRKQTEESLRESEEKFRLMMESMKDPAYITSTGYRIRYMNPKMISLIGRDATGENCHKAIYERDEICSWCVFDHILEGEHAEYELANPKDNRYYSVTNSPIYSSGESISKLTILHDITERKALEEQLRQVRKMESLGTLTGGIAHDFNNILGIIVGNTELALEDIPEWNPVHSNLEEIKAGSLRAAGIVKQLLNFSRKVDQQLKPVGAITVIKDALKFLRSTIPSNIEIRTHLPAKDMTILADPIQINQVMINICSNASKEMEKTGGILEITIEDITLDEEAVNGYSDVTTGDYIKITVSDTGPGINPEIIDLIFDPYFTTKEVGKGSGMGLAVVHGIVKNHRGAITVDSQYGQGATFTILFPVVTEKPVTEVKASDEIPRGNETILFVDDEKSIADVAGLMLERLGYKVEIKTNPVEALELFQLEPAKFDLVITDMTMPQMTGIKLAEKLKADRFDLPVIICTGHSSLINEEKAKAMGISDFVMKPIMMRGIAKTIRKVLDESKTTAND
jgi:PAS domain S-box-containing protein